MVGIMTEGTRFVHKSISRKRSERSGLAHFIRGQWFALRSAREACLPSNRSGSNAQTRVETPYLPARSNDSFIFSGVEFPVFSAHRSRRRAFASPASTAT